MKVQLPEKDATPPRRVLRCWNCARYISCVDVLLCGRCSRRYVQARKSGRLLELTARAARRLQ